MKITFFFIVLFIASFQLVTAQTGTVAGTITDGEFNDILPFATVSVNGTQKGTTTDFDGKYTLELAPGIYTITFSFVGYSSKEITQVEVKENAVTDINVTLNSSAGQLEEVVISTTARKNTEAAVLRLQQNSVVLQDGLSIESIKKVGVSDVASAVKNIPGVSVQGGKFVYVRGLGDRYTKSILNGVDIPGLDPNRNTLQLDIFPTQTIENIIVIKSSTADQPADFTGGVVDIVTKDIPNREEYSVSTGIGYNSNFHFKSDYLTQDRSGTDFLGFDDGLRSNPIAENQNIPLPQQDGGLVRALTQQFEPKLAAEQETSFLDYNFAATGGNSFDIGDDKLGVLASFSYRNETTYYDDYINGQVFRKNANNSITDLDTERSQQGRLGNNNVLISGLAGLSFKTEQSKYKLNILHLQNGESESSIFRESNRITSSNVVKKDNLLYTERSITNILLNNVHTFNESKWTIEYKLSPTLARVEDKDFRITPFRVSQDPVTGEQVFTIEPSEAGDATRIFRDLEEINLAGKLDLTLKNKLFGYDAKTKFGGAYTYKERDFNTFQYSLPLLNTASADFGGDPNQLLAPDNIYDPDTNSGVYIRDDTNDTNFYDSDITVAAGYFSEEFKFNKWFNAIAGVRVEKFDLTYTGESQSRGEFNNVKVIEELDFFPSLNLIFDLDEDGDIKIRTSYSRTTARPSFKEASVAEIFDPIENTFFLGNIDIRPTYINNFDLRFEKYGEDGNFFAVSAFYKQFDDPIELSFIREATGQFTPLNLGDATVLGGEIEFRGNLGFIPGLQNFDFNANVSVIDSRQEFSDDEREARLDNLREDETLDDTRQLQGQSPYLLNVGLNYSNDTGWQGGLFYNSQGRTLQIVGAGNIPDVYTLPYHNVKLNFSKTFGDEITSKISLRFDNLFNDDIESVYESFGTNDEVYSKWSPGQAISLSYSINF